MQLASTLQGIVTQTLLPTADGKGRAVALEILFLDDAIRNLIRQGKIEQVYSYMQTGTRRGMQTMEQSLTELVEKQIITVPEAVGRSSRPEALVSALERAGIPIPAMSNDGAPAATPGLGAALRVAGELAANDPVEPPERVLRHPEAGRRRPVRVVRSHADGRPAARRPGSARDRLRRDPGREPRRLRRSSQEPDRLRARRGRGHRAALSHRALVQAPPRAAARTTTSDVPEHEMHLWQTPQAMSDETIDSEPDFFELDAPALEVAAVAPGAEKVPFFKREISFRRKRATDGDPATEVADDEQSTDLAAAADEDYGIRGYDEEREAAVTDDDSVSDDADDLFEVEILAVESR